MGACFAVKKKEPKLEERDTELYRQGSEMNLIPDENCVQSFDDIFQEMEVLGTGATADVMRMRDKTTEEEFGVKKISRCQRGKRYFQREVKILSGLEHDHIIRVQGVYADCTSFFIVQDFCAGGTLLACLTGKGIMAESLSMAIIAQLLKALQFLHSNDIVHHDVKPENLAFEQQDRNNLILIDFGQALRVSDEEKQMTRGGTLPFLAPESGRWRTGAELKKADMWAVGVTVFMMLTNVFPFWGRDYKHTMRQIRSNKVKFPRGVKVSSKARNFVESLLNKNVGDRPTAAEALKHDWIAQA